MNALTIPAFQAAAARLNAMGDQASKVLAELKRAPTSDELDDDFESFALALQDAGSHIARAEKVLREEDGWDKAGKLAELVIAELGGVPATPVVRAVSELAGALVQIVRAAEAVALLPTCGERDTLRGIANLARKALAVAGETA